MAKGGLIGVPVIALLCVGAWLLFSWPLSYEYHHWIPVKGSVTQTNKRLNSCGDGCVEQRFVAVINGQPYGIDDTRASLLKPGDKVSLRCKKEYVYGTPRGSHGWACNWIGGGRG
jgi:hypothetical protein